MVGRGAPGRSSGSRVGWGGPGGSSAGMIRCHLGFVFLFLFVAVVVVVVVVVVFFTLFCN
jgi:hypothetical protein